MRVRHSSPYVSAGVNRVRDADNKIGYRCCGDAAQHVIVVKMEEAREEKLEEREGQLNLSQHHQEVSQAGTPTANWLPL